MMLNNDKLRDIIIELGIVFGIFDELDGYD